MGSGVIYAVIVVVWAGVLVPMWLRRHDEVTETRSVDRFQGAMRTLSRREPGVDRREVLMPGRRATRAVPDGAAGQISAASRAAVRRQRIVLVLAVVTLLLLVAARVRHAPVWLALLPLVLLVAYVATMSLSGRRAKTRELTARRARAAAQRRAQQAAAAESLATGAYAVRGSASVSAPVAVEAVRDRPFDQYVVETWVPSRAAAAKAAAAQTYDPGFYDAVAERVWEPVPVPLPTYVLAPKAPRSVRVIDLTKPGSWTSGHLDEDELVEIDDQTGLPLGARPAAGGEPSGPPRDGIVTGEVLIERLRAVGD